MCQLHYLPGEEEVERSADRRVKDYERHWVNRPYPFPMIGVSKTRWHRFKVRGNNLKVNLRGKFLTQIG